MKNNLKKGLRDVFEAPMPGKKSVFLSQFNYPKANKFDFIKSQLGYIRKRIWFLSVLLFIVAFLVLYFHKADAPLIWIMSSILPFISLLSINEIVRGIAYGMEELEMSCKHNLLQISLVRLGILGIVNFIIFIGILLIFIGRIDYGFFRLGLYLTTPYLLNCYGSLFVINRLRSREITFICGGVTFLVILLNALISIQINDIYTERYWLFWMSTFMVLVILSIAEVVKLIKKMEELQYGSSIIA